MFFDDDPNAGGGGGDDDSGEGDKTFDWKAPTGKVFKLPESMREVVGHASAWGRKDADKRYKEKMSNL